MDMPLTQRDPRFTMWSYSPSIAINLPSRTAAIMPHPQEQKLHEVVNSLTFASFNFWVAALTVDKSIRPSKASPTLPARATLNRSLRLTDAKPLVGGESIGRW